VVYLDENLSGPKIASVLRGFGDWRVETHYDHYPREGPTIPDPVVVERCAAEGWLLISCDDRLRFVPHNKGAVLKHRAKVYMFPEGNYHAHEYTAALTMARRNLINIARKTHPPFFARIYINGDVRLLDRKPIRNMTSKERTQLKYGTTDTTDGSHDEAQPSHPPPGNIRARAD
jgi:PIN like domain